MNRLARPLKGKMGILRLIHRFRNNFACILKKMLYYVYIQQGFAINVQSDFFLKEQTVFQYGILQSKILKIYEKGGCCYE
jgi:hypothetical protein